MKPVRIYLLYFICFSFLCGCGAVRWAGKVTAATGNAMAKGADEEEAKRKAKKDAGAPPAEPVKKGEKESPPVQAAEPSPQTMTVTEIKEIQQCLTQLGYQPGPVDGKMGKNTKEALKQFQQKYNLRKTGEADKETVDKLRQEAKVPQKSAPVKVRSATDL
jgi:peptidoglycan hydrolase-like protein with peptidoglycan-binding domain